MSLRPAHSPGLVSFGLATLCSFPFLTPLISQRHLAVFHLAGNPSLLFVPPLLYFAAFWILSSAILTVSVHHPRVRVAFWSVVLCSIPWFGTKAIAVSFGKIVPSPVSAALLFVSFLCLIAVAMFLWRPGYARLLPIIHFIETAFTFVAWTGFLLLAQVLWFFFAARHLNEPPGSTTASSLRPPIHQRSPRRRVVWIILDELSVDQIFGHRFPGLSLPAFDRLRAQSVLFTEVIPAGKRTERVVPALVTGIPVEHISASADGENVTLIDPSGRSHPFDPNDTVFGDAVRDGYTTGIVGWYNPYCRLLSTVLDRCFWVPHHDTLPGGFRTDRTIVGNLAAPILSAVRFGGRFLAPSFSDRWTDRLAMDEHIAEARDLSAAAQNLLADPSLDFLFLHMAAPHPEGIYDRHTNAFIDTGQSSYIDNLALADRILSQIETSMRSRGEWDNAAVIVMGDHSWRTRELWREIPGWTAEDEQASFNGSFDPRPAYLVKLPGEQAPKQVDATFDAVRTRALLDQLLNGTIDSPEALVSWASNR